MSDPELLKQSVDALKGRSVYPIPRGAFLGIYHPHHTNITWRWSKRLAIWDWIQMLNLNKKFSWWWDHRPWKEI